MKLSKEYILTRLQTTSVHDLAVEIAGQTVVNGVDLPATVRKYEAMLKPLAPVEVKASDLMESMGIHVVRIS
jgi:hypothetical protein